MGTVSQRRWDQAGNARTLIQAHEALVRLRPTPDAPIPEWIAFHQRSSAVYQTVADVDEGHHLEALYWANREKSKADELATSTVRRRQARGMGSATAVPATLQQAHDVLREVRPPLVAAPAAWRAYHEHAAAVYTEVFEVDRGHHHEAVVWASRERVMAAAMTGRADVDPVSRVKPGRLAEQS